MGFLGGAPLSTPREELLTATERFQPTFGLAASAAFQESRSLFGLKPLQDLSEIAKLRGHEGTELFGVNAGAFDLMRDKEIGGTPTSRLIDPDEANETYGIEGELKFTEPISEDEAKFKQLRKLEEIDRNYILQQNKGFMRNLSTFGIEFVADITDPIGLGTLLFPVTSFRTVAKLTQKAGRFMPYGIGMGEAAAGIVVPLTPGYFASQEFQYDFTPGDYGISLLGGIALGGVIRRLIFMKDIKNLKAMTQHQEDNFDATINFIETDVKNQSQKSDDIVTDHAAERTRADNSDSRKFGAIQNSEGKFDLDIMDSYLNIVDDLLRVGRVPIKENIESYASNIKDLKKHIEDLRKLLNEVPAGDHKVKVSKTLKAAEGYLKINETRKKALTKRLAELDKSPEGTSDPKLAEESRAKQEYIVNSIEYEVVGKGSETRKLWRGRKTKKARKALADKIRALLDDDEALLKILDGEKLRKNAYELLDEVIKKEGALTLNSLVRVLKRDGLDEKKVQAFLDKIYARYAKPQNEAITSSGDLAAIDYQNGVDLTAEQRVGNDVKDDVNNDTEFGHREYTTDSNAVAEAADAEAESVDELIDMMLKNVKSEENPNGIYSKKVIEMIRDRRARGEIDDVKTETALETYDSCVRKNK